jgi:cilia- and flagella-associated protein 65
VFVPPPKTNPEFVAPTASLNFGQLELGRVSMKTVELVNHTRAQAFYQFVTEPTGCFELSRADGTIIPESRVNIDIRFKARIPGNYYRRIFILIKNQGPLFLDLTATAYHQLQDQVPRPMPLYQRHVELYRQRLRDERKPHAAAIYDSENKGDPTAESWNEFFFDDTDERREIYLQESNIDFGAMSGVGIGDYKAITVVNRTDVKYTAMFMVPPDNYVEQPEGAGEIEHTTLGPVLRPLETCWKVFPEKADVLPHSSTQFKVAFRPVYGNAYYAQALEVFAYPKSQRNFRLVNDDNFVPPHCVTPVCSGNTFPASMEPFTPKLRVPTTRINFPACTVNDKAYQVVEMYNDADTPMRYQFDADQAGIFLVKPNNGLIMPQRAQLVAFKFWPKEAQRYEHHIMCTMNGSVLHAVEFTLVGKGNATAVTLDTQHLQIKPTCVGSVTTRTVDIHNPTGVPMYYNWSIPEAYRKCLLVEPKQGVLRGNERHTLYWHFAPKKSGTYAIKVPVTIERAQVRNLADDDFTSTAELAETMSSTYGALTKKAQTIWLNIYGTGSGGAVTFEPAIIDFNELVVGTEVTQVIKLINRSDCTMYHNIVSSMPNNLNYKDGEGCIAGNSTKRVTICFTPSERKYYNVQITCKLSTGSEALSTLDKGPNHTGIQLLQQIPLEEEPDCQVLGNAVYPTLAVMDVRALARLEDWRATDMLPWEENQGGPYLRDPKKAMVPAAYSASRLWTELNLLEMNEQLSSDLTDKEILWNKAEIDETNPSKVLKVIDVRFEVKEQGSQPSVKVMRLKNTGVLPFDLLLKYPKDDEDEPENWVDKDLQGEEELKLNYMLENKLFIIEPRRAHLEVGEEIDLILSYKHTVKDDPRADPPFSLLYHGDFRLPVVLNVCQLPPAGGVINSGKQIVLNCIGKTLFVKEPYLLLPQPDSTRFPRLCAPHLDIRSQCKECLNFDGIADYELLGSGRTPFQWGFERTPIGLMQPPIQYYKVTNLGSVPLSFHMDLSEVEELNASNYNFEVVSVLDNNDLESIEPGESIMLRWVFNPLEPKMYRWKVPFQIHGYDGHEYEVVVYFCAEGFQEDPHVTPVTTVMPLPMYQILPLPNQSVFLSEERLCLGDIPIGASITRMIFLSNFHQDDVMDFAFVLSSSLAKDVVEVFPSEGEIMPESHVAIRVTIRCMVASVWDFDIPVLVRTKPPPQEENEDLADDEPEGEGGPATPTSARPATSVTGTSARGSARGSAAGDKGKKKKRKVSIVEQPPPAHKTMKPARTGGKGQVSFVETSQMPGGGGEKKGASFAADDTASVKSGSSRISGMTGHSGAGSAASGHSASVAGSKAHADDDDAEVDMSLYLSIQAHVRPPELHRRLFLNDKYFWFPKGALLPTDSFNYDIPEDLVKMTTRASELERTAGTAASGASNKGLKSPATRGDGNNSRPVTAEGARKTGTAAADGVVPMRMAVTESLLEALLGDVLGDEDVINAFSQLDKPPAPCYVQLVKGTPAPFVHQPATAYAEEDAPATRDEQDGPADAEGGEAHKLRPLAGGGGAQVATIESPRDRDIMGGTARLVYAQMAAPGIGAANDWMVLAGCDVPGHSAQVPLEKTPEEKEEELLFSRRRQVMRLPEFENLAHFVLDACVFNLLEEATFGEEDLIGR